MASKNKVQDRILGVWGVRAYAWSGEERPRAAGFPIDLSGRQRVLGFPPDSFGPVNRDWFRWLGHSVGCHKRPGSRPSAANEAESKPDI